MEPRALALMKQFAARTGVTGERPPRRYLWTDAFAACNFLALGQPELALRLVDQVHHQLGRHRPDDARRGWISGASEADGEAHPTRGGLRIGKPLPERAAGDPLDEELEWDRDGQYFHYLTKWMHALAQVGRTLARPELEACARELADVAHRRFVRGRRMVWKMSIDLSRPQVASMGHHDPLDGYLTCRELGGPMLDDATRHYGAMIVPEALATDDPLGIGGLLVDASRLAQLGGDGALQGAVIEAALAGLTHYAARPNHLRRPAEQRLGFRELGLAIGLGAALEIDAMRFGPFAWLGDAIQSFWLDPEHRRARTWLDHEDINDVMLATCLAPRGFTTLAPR